MVAFTQSVEEIFSSKDQNKGTHGEKVLAVGFEPLNGGLRKN